MRALGQHTVFFWAAPPVGGAVWRKRVKDGLGEEEGGSDKNVTGNFFVVRPPLPRLLLLHHSNNNSNNNNDPRLAGLTQQWGSVASQVLTFQGDLAGEAWSQPGVCKGSATSPMMGDTSPGVVARRTCPSGVASFGRVTHAPADLRARSERYCGELTFLCGAAPRNPKVGSWVVRGIFFNVAGRGGGGV